MFVLVQVFVRGEEKLLNGCRSLVYGILEN